MGDALFHILPLVSAEASKSMNTLTTSIVLITIAVMLCIDAALHVRSQVNNQVLDAAAAPPQLDAKGSNDLEMQQVATNEPSKAVAHAPSQSSATAAYLPPFVKQPHMSLRALLKQPEIIVNLTGEALHNFTDGIAIAAAFSLSWTTGASAMLLHASRHADALHYPHSLQALQPLLRSSSTRFLRCQPPQRKCHNLCVSESRAGA